MEPATRVRRLTGRDYFWLKDFDCSPLPVERDSIYLLFCLHFPALCFIAEQQYASRPIGYVLGLMAMDGRSAHMHALFVDPNHRRAGIGRLLVERFKAAARDSRARQVVLYTVRAEAFYAHLGFARGWPGIDADIRGHIEHDRGALCMHHALDTEWN